MRIIPLLPLLAAAAWAQDYGETHRLKVDISGDSRKIAFFIPKTARAGDVLPVLVAVPGNDGRSFNEVGQWQLAAKDGKFAVFSVDITTSSETRPWHPNDQLDMQRDMEAVVEGLKVAEQQAKDLGITLDDSAYVITGHSGGTFLTLWLGLRRPDLFLGVCGRSVCYFKETLDFEKFGATKPNLGQAIYLFHGELDAARCKKDTVAAVEALKAMGFKNVDHKMVPKMSHEPKPEECLEWFEKLLKQTAKGRKERAKVKEELAELMPDLEAGKAGALSKLDRLVERETKAGFPAGAQAVLDGVLKKAKESWDRAETLAADGQMAAAEQVYKEIEDTYRGLDISKEARSARVKLARTDAYKAEEMLTTAKQLQEKDLKEKAAEILEKLIAQYPDTPAAQEAGRLLKG